jgi:hypothetical protein
MTQTEVVELAERIRRGERGDDIPILMEDAGCDYEQSCDLVFGGRNLDALNILGAAVLTAGKITT